jgi:hypothetical protein
MTVPNKGADTQCRKGLDTKRFGTVDQLASAPEAKATRMLFNHYRDLVAPEDATAFWEIMP